MQRKITISVIVIIIVSIIGFYSGIKYGQNSLSASVKNARRNFQGNFGTSSATANNFRNFGKDGTTAGMVNGEIIAKDATSVTVKLRDGSSKIIFYSTSTQISKMANGSADDLTIGKNVSISGSANQDGSITSQSIQIRPNLPAQPTQPTSAEN
jgi:hypothetical protein